VVEQAAGGGALLRVSPYNFYWQLFYRLAQPLRLKAGTDLSSSDTSTNSRRIPITPIP